MEPKTGKKIVSKGAYAVRKSFAVVLSGGFVICCVGILLLVASPFLASYLEEPIRMACLKSGNRLKPGASCELFPYSDLAFEVSIFLVPLLLCATFPLFYGKRKTWETLRTLQVIPSANTADLPAPDSLVRASEEPLQAHEAILLRAVAERVETPSEQLLRASVSFSASRSGRPGQE